MRILTHWFGADLASMKMHKKLKFLEYQQPGGVYHTVTQTSIIIIFMIIIVSLTSPVLHDTIATNCQGKFYREIQIGQ